MKKNIPNIITLIRIALIPVFLLFVILGFECNAYRFYTREYIHTTWSTYYLPDFTLNYIFMFIAAGIFALAAFTDFLDGYIARKYNLVSDMGKFLDPIADKLLVTAALSALVERGEISSWIAVIIISREFIVTGLRVIAMSSSGKVIAAGTLGKLKTATQFIALTMTFFDNFGLNLITVIRVNDVFMLLAVLLTIISGCEYIIKNKSLLIQ